MDRNVGSKDIVRLWAVTFKTLRVLQSFTNLEVHKRNMTKPKNLVLQHH